MHPPVSAGVVLRAATRTAVPVGRALPSLAQLAAPLSTVLAAPAAVFAARAYSTPSSMPALAPLRAQTPATGAPVRHVSSAKQSSILARIPLRAEASLFVRPSPSKALFSTTTAVTYATAAAEAASSASTGAAPQLLDWNTFFRLRKTRRRFQLTFSILMFVAAGFGSFVYFGTGAAEAVVSQIPLDPFFTLGLMTLGCGALGWLIGPSIGSGLFYAFNRRWKSQMRHKENEFFARIQKHRVDPTNSSTANPVPDYYGERISSVAGYRQWLKDQRAFNKKRTSFV